MSKELWTTSLKRPRDRIIYKKKIGSGSYGEVWLAEWDGMLVAAKRIHQGLFETDYGQDVIDYYSAELTKEWETLRNLEHKNIVKMYMVKFNPPVIVMELMHCDLLHYIKMSTSTPKVSPSEVVSIALGVAEGLEYLHGLPNPIVHRDLATKNILLTKDGHPKIADLGVAKVFAAGQDAFATAGPGTPLYAAPETYKDITNYKAKYGVKADMFSFGVVLLEMSVGHEPRVLPCFSERKKISELKRRKTDIDEMEDNSLKKLVIDCLQEKSTSRPNASEVVTVLKRIKEEMEVEKRQLEQAVTFEKLCDNLAPQHDHSFKVLLLGNRFVGKSSLFQVLKNPAFNIDTVLMKATVTIEPMAHYFKYDTQIVKMDLVDTSGEERYFCLTSSYYRDVDGVFLTYDVSDKVSLQSLKFWRSKLKEYNDKDNLHMLLVGNKVDLRQSKDSKEMVPQQEALDMARRFHCPHVETSVKDFESVMAMYKKMVGMLITTVKIQDVDIQIEEPTKIVRLPSSRKKNAANKKKCSSCRKS